MKKVLSSLLLALPVYLAITFYFLDKDSFLYPVDTKGYLIIRSDARGDGFFASKRNGRRLHNGIDLFAEIGAPVFAVRSGIVITATNNNGMGKYVVVRHANNLTSIYGHLSEICVRLGEFVRQGELIGKVGKTGNANFRDIQPHLHFEMRKDNTPQDPLLYLD